PPPRRGDSYGYSSYLGDLAESEVRLQVPVPRSVVEENAAAAKFAHAGAHAGEPRLEKSAPVENQDALLRDAEVAGDASPSLRRRLYDQIPLDSREGLRRAHPGLEEWAAPVSESAWKPVGHQHEVDAGRRVGLSAGDGAERRDRDEPLAELG